MPTRPFRSRYVFVAPWDVHPRVLTPGHELAVRWQGDRLVVARLGADALSGPLDGSGSGLYVVDLQRGQDWGRPRTMVVNGDPESLARVGENDLAFAQMAPAWSSTPLAWPPALEAAPPLPSSLAGRACWWTAAAP